MDAFAVERKHHYFKSEVASRHKTLGNFARFCLLELGEMDAKMTDPVATLTTELVGNIQESNVLAKKTGCVSAVVAQGLHYLAVQHSKGQFKILPNNTAVEVMGACKLDNDHFLLCHELTKERDIAKGFTRWKKPFETETLCLLPSETISMSEAAAFARVHCKDNEKHVWLLQG